MSNQQDEREARVVCKRNTVVVERGAEVLGSFVGPDCEVHAELFRAALANQRAEAAWPTIHEIRSAWDLAYVPQGGQWKLAPVEPTPEMEDAAMREITANDEDFRDDYLRSDFRVSYRAALASAPTQPPAAQAMVPLTDEQVEKMSREWVAEQVTDYEDLIRRVEAKFCEVNGIGTAKPAQPRRDYCPEKLKPGGCQLHNLHCGFPKCNDQPVQPEGGDQ